MDRSFAEITIDDVPEKSVHVLHVTFGGRA
jgi:hypothetical protein